MFTAEVHVNQVHLSAVFRPSGYDGVHSYAINFSLALCFITHIMRAERQMLWQDIHMTSGVRLCYLVFPCKAVFGETDTNKQKC